MREKESLDVSFARVIYVDDLILLLDLYGDLFRKDDGGEVFVLLRKAIWIEGIRGEFADDFRAVASNVIFAGGNIRFKDAVDNFSACRGTLTVRGGEVNHPRFDSFVRNFDRAGDMKEFGPFAASDGDKRATAESGEKKESIFHAFDFHFM